MKWMIAAVFSCAFCAACDQNDKPGQTITTAADHAADAGARELKREWQNLDIKVQTGGQPTLGAGDAGVTLKGGR